MFCECVVPAVVLLWWLASGFFAVLVAVGIAAGVDVRVAVGTGVGRTVGITVMTGSARSLRTGDGSPTDAHAERTSSKPTVRTVAALTRALRLLRITVAAAPRQIHPRG